MSLAAAIVKQIVTVPSPGFEHALDKLAEALRVRLTAGDETSEVPTAERMQYADAQAERALAEWVRDQVECNCRDDHA